tara:strand:- start:124 stop:402 length:279 start_codon:yes stop_codon:yes gene_type:complete
MSLSREKINHLSQLIVKDLQTKDLVDFLRDPNDIRLHVVKVLTEELKIENEVNVSVRKILSSYSKKINEGNREWDVMYNKLYEQEWNKHRKF